MTTEFCENVLGDNCEEGPRFSIPLPDENAPLAMLGRARFLVYDDGSGRPEATHKFETETVILASPPVEGGAQVLWLVGDNLVIDDRGIGHTEGDDDDGQG